MKAIIAWCLLATTFAGCVDEGSPTAEPALDGPDSGKGSVDPPVVFVNQVSVQPELAGNGAWYHVTVEGSVDREATVFVSPDRHEAMDTESVEANETFTIKATFWSAEPGLLGITTNAIVFGDDDNVTSSPVPSVLNLPAPATIQIDYGSAAGAEPVNDSVWVDIVDYAATSQYDEQGAQHPDYVNIHDVMVSWEQQHGHEVEYSYNSGFNSFSVESIDGHGNGLAGSPPWWCYQVNGEYANQGISIQRFTPGDIIAWDLGTCGGVMGGT